MDFQLLYAIPFSMKVINFVFNCASLWIYSMKSPRMVFTSFLISVGRPISPIIVVPLIFTLGLVYLFVPVISSGGLMIMFLLIVSFIDTSHNRLDSNRLSGRRGLGVEHTWIFIFHLFIFTYLSYRIYPQCIEVDGHQIISSLWLWWCELGEVPDRFLDT